MSEEEVEDSQRRVILCICIIGLSIFVLILLGLYVFKSYENNYYKQQMLNFCELSKSQRELIEILMTDKLKDIAEEAGFYPFDVMENCENYVFGHLESGGIRG